MTRSISVHSSHIAGDDMPGPEWVSSACVLPTEQQPLRVAEFDALFARSLRSVQRLSARLLRLVLDASAGTAARELTERETQCCSFFEFALHPADAMLTIDVAVPLSQVDVLDGLESRCDQLLDAGGR